MIDCRTPDRGKTEEDCRFCNDVSGEEQVDRAIPTDEGFKDREKLARRRRRECGRCHRQTPRPAVSKRQPERHGESETPAARLIVWSADSDTLRKENLSARSCSVYMTTMAYC